MGRKLIISVIFFILITITVAMLAFNGRLGSDNNSSSSSFLSKSQSSNSSSNIKSSKLSQNSHSSSFSSISVASNEGGNLTQVNPDVILDYDKISALSNEKKGWGAGYGKNNAQPPISSKIKLLFKSYNAFCIGSAASKKNYLTFDEGYENGYTSQILDTLKDKNVKAVFFVTTPYVKSNKSLVRRMLDEGHAIGNHSTKHKSFPDMSIDEIKGDVLTLHTLMQKEFNYDIWLFRYPNGEYSERSLEILKEVGYTTVFWSFAYKDYDVSNQLGTDFAYNKVVSNAHNGAVYLLHAVSKDNANALGEIIDTLRENGYELSLIDDIPE